MGIATNKGLNKKGIYKGTCVLACVGCVSDKTIEKNQHEFIRTKRSNRKGFAVREA